MLDNPRATHPFPSTALNSTRGIAKFIATNLAAGALEWVEGQGLGWVAQSAGLTTPGATAAQVMQLQQSLDSLQSSGRTSLDVVVQVLLGDIHVGSQRHRLRRDNEVLSLGQLVQNLLRRLLQLPAQLINADDWHVSGHECGRAAVDVPGGSRGRGG